MTPVCFDISDVSFSYGRKQVINGISKRIRSGVFYGILGPNGCGKSTLLDLMVGHKYSHSGSIFFKRENLKQLSKPRLSRHIALVSQNFYINFPYTVNDIVMMGRYPHIPRFASPSEKDYKVVKEVMAITGVNRLKDQMVTELSGGERQRTVFARALAQDTDVLLLDEATSNLDINHTIALLDVVKKKVQENRTTVISVFQDINLAAVYCDEMIYMNAGKVVAGGPVNEMMNETIIEDVFQVDSKIRFEPRYQAKQAIFKTGVQVS